MLTREQKQQIVSELSEKFKANPSLFVVEYKGLSVKEIEMVRKSLRGAEAEFKVVKNTLLKRAAKGTSIEEINFLFEGPTAIAICSKDSPEVAKIFVKSSKQFPNLKVKGGVVEGMVVDPSQIEQISKLPSKNELIAQFMGLVKTPIVNFVGAVKQMQLRLVYALEALKEKKKDQ